MQKLQDLKLSVVSLKKELAWAFVVEKKQVENIYEMVKMEYIPFLPDLIPSVFCNDL